MLSQNENNNISARLVPILRDYWQRIFAFLEIDKKHYRDPFILDIVKTSKIVFKSSKHGFLLVFLLSL